jgi:hypothetical protein
MCILAIPLRLHGTSGPRCVLLRHGCRYHDGVAIEQQNWRYQDDPVILQFICELADCKNALHEAETTARSMLMSRKEFLFHPAEAVEPLPSMPANLPRCG